MYFGKAVGSRKVLDACAQMPGLWCAHSVVFYISRHLLVGTCGGPACCGELFWETFWAGGGVCASNCPYFGLPSVVSLKRRHLLVGSCGGGPACWGVVMGIL